MNGRRKFLLLDDVQINDHRGGRVLDASCLHRPRCYHEFRGHHHRLSRIRSVLGILALVMLVGSPVVCSAGILALDVNKKLPSQVVNVDSPGYKSDTLSGGKRFAEAYKYANDDNVRSKGPNFWAAYDLAFKDVKPVDILFSAWNDATVQQYGKDEFGFFLIRDPATGMLDVGAGVFDRDPDIGTPKTTEYWMPLTLANMSAKPWGGVKFTIGFGTYVIDPISGKLKDEFVGAGTVDLDFDFNFVVEDGKAGKDLVIDPNGQNSTDTGLALITTKNQPDTFTRFDQTGVNPIPVNNVSGTFQWSIDVPNWDKIPEKYRFTDKNTAGENIDAYHFTIRIEPLLVAEPSSLALLSAGGVILLLDLARRRPSRRRARGQRN